MTTDSYTRLDPSTSSTDMLVQSNSYPTSSYAVGDEVMFAKRCQTSAGPMRIQEVDVTMFDVRLKVGGQWWSPGAFMPYPEWERLHGPRSH